MIIAIRKEPNRTLYMDKEIYTRTQEVQDENGNITIQPLFSEKELSKPPYNYTKVEIDDKYSDCQASDFNDDLTFSIEKYNVNQELAILRQRDTKPQEFAEYNEYVEQCKEQVKNGI